MSWRPEGWKGLETVADPAWVEIDKALYEAGADAMLQALRAMGIEGEPSSSIIGGFAMLPPYWHMLLPDSVMDKLGIKGHGILVFIPDEEVKGELET